MTPDTALSILADSGRLDTDTPPTWRYVERVTSGCWIIGTADGRRHIVSTTVASED